jgi:hypothetical protein
MTPAELLVWADDGGLEPPEDEPVALRLVPTPPQSPPWLTRYVALGFSLVFWPRLPDPENEWKGPRDKKWPTKTYTPANYHDGMQVGVKLGVEIAPGKFLVDLDLDWAPGIRFLHRFVPDTGFVFGRKSKPHSHALYTTSAPVAIRKFKDVDAAKTNLGELRGTKTDGTIGNQTVLPPSVHRESGDTVTMETDGDITHTDAVVEGYTHYMIACLLGRHWPKNGPDTNQHDTAGYAAGFLCQRGVDPARVPVIIEVAATLGGDDNVPDRVLYARDTIAKFKDGDKPLTGGPNLAKELGEHVVARLREWLPSADPIEEAIERLNERNAIISVGNKVVVMEMWPDGSIRTLWPFEEFKRKHIKEFVTVGDGRKPLADIWLKDSRGRHYDRLVYAMPGSAERCEPGDYNGWLGFTVTPRAGDWTQNRRHLQLIICGGKANSYEWVFNWCAALVQWPGRHAMSSLVLRGGQGVGKGHFAHLMLGALFHKQQYLHIIGEGMLTGRFNEHLSGKVLVFADESTWGGDPAAADKLKGMVTESTVPIERKFLPLVEEPSALHIVIASNNEWPIAIPMDDRRFMVLDVEEARRQDDTYFAPLREELKNGGLAAMLHDLLAHKVDEYALRHPLSTEAKRDVMTQSLTAIQRWWYEKLVTGSLKVTVTNTTDEGKETTTTIDGWDGSVPKAALHDDYLAFLDRHRDTRTRRSTETELGMFLRKYTPMRSQRRLPGTGESTKARYVWDVPSLEECRASWAKACGWPEDYEWD